MKRLKQDEKTMAAKQKDTEKKKHKLIKTEKFPFVIIPLILVCIGILYCMVKTMTVEKERWVQMRKENFEEDSVILKPQRGNILSSEGELLASSLPNYKVRFDFLSGIPSLPTDSATSQKAHAEFLEAQEKRDSLISKKDSVFTANLPSIASGLARICPALDSAGYVRHLTKGMELHARYYDICPGWILNYIQYNELRKLPLFNVKGKYSSGLIVEERNNRKKPFGSLARRTLGEMFGAKDSARSGLELAYDTLLRGKSGLLHRRRIRSRNVEQVDLPAQDGYDLVSTINVSMQDICESALRAQCQELKASFGVCVLMEVKTGDVKAIVNLVPDSAGHYYEARNYALSALMEPGSTFKTASIMVALDDGEITMNDTVCTGIGIKNMYGAHMKDSSFGRGGYGTLDVTGVMMHSSNIGVSTLIDRKYHNKPEKFIEGLHRIGIAEPLGLPFAGMVNPQIYGPDSKTIYWSRPSLAWMSIGYGTQIPPISTVTFYNAIANGGRMVRPRFVRGIARNGEMVKEFPVEVIKEHICKEQTLKDIQGILYKVVNEKGGTGKAARSKHFNVSGKTGTAQVATAGGYGSRSEHLVSFCGYYPSEKPQYTCIVSIRTSAPGASGGRMSGSVFAKIAERVYSKQVSTNIVLARDSLSVFVPEVKNGAVQPTENLLSLMGIHFQSTPKDSNSWAQMQTSGNDVTFRPIETKPDRMPDLTGMGARDAVYAIESRGMRAKVRGYGRVKSQSLAAGSRIRRGGTVTIDMD